MPKGRKYKLDEDDCIAVKGKLYDRVNKRYQNTPGLGRHFWNNAARSIKKEQAAYKKKYMQRKREGKIEKKPEKIAALSKSEKILHDCFFKMKDEISDPQKFKQCGACGKYERWHLAQHFRRNHPGVYKPFALQPGQHPNRYWWQLPRPKSEDDDSCELWYAENQAGFAILGFVYD